MPRVRYSTDPDADGTGWIATFNCDCGAVVIARSSHELGPYRGTCLSGHGVTLRNCR
jgi:hypothetical protein